jgi:uncharacterized coiled-coil DUF342 family protein
MRIVEIIQKCSERRELIVDFLKGNKELGENAPDRELISMILDRVESSQLKALVAEMESPDFQNIAQELKPQLENYTKIMEETQWAREKVKAHRAEVLSMRKKVDGLSAP